MKPRSTGRSITLIVVGLVALVGSTAALLAGGQILWWLVLAAGIVALVVGVMDLAKKRGQGTDPRA